MPNGVFNAKKRHQALANILRPIDLENALLFCSHVLAAWRGENCAPAIQQLVRELRLPPAPFLVHLAARQVLLQSLGTSNRGMGTDDFKRMIGLLWELIDHDPAMEDPGWKTSDPTGWAVRYLGLQERPVEIKIQNYGLAAALFTEEMPVASDERISTPARVEGILGMHPAVFMRAGFVAMSVRLGGGGGITLPGTVSTKCIQDHAAELRGGIAQNWDRFRELVSSTHSAFKARSREIDDLGTGSRYALYKFNLLKRFPLVDVGRGRFIAPDPQLVLARTTLGMYYFGLEADGEDFTRSFGYRLANLVGDLTRRACSGRQVWSESTVPKSVRSNPPSKNADHAVIENSATTLIECKALKPSTKLLMLGDPADATELVDRVGGAVRQLTEHASAIRAGKWSAHGLRPSYFFGLVVTYGRIPTCNGLLFRAKLQQRLRQEGCDPIPYLVLSLTEYDSLLRLVERGHELGQIIKTLTADDAPNFPGQYQADLTEDAVSSLTRARAEAFLETLPGEAASVTA